MSKNHEKEWKILEVNKKEIEERIIELWWFLDSVNERVISIRMKNSRWKKVRLRDDWNSVVAEHKWKKKRSKKWIKSADETRAWVCSLANWVWLFEVLWFKQTSEDIKSRTTYILDLWESWWKVKLEFDAYSDLDWLSIPTLLEIEALTEETIIEVTKLLWLNPSDLKHWWSRKLSAYYTIQYIFSIMCMYPNIFNTPEFKNIVFLVFLNIFLKDEKLVKNLLNDKKKKT